MWSANKLCGRPVQQRCDTMQKILCACPCPASDKAALPTGLCGSTNPDMEQNIRLPACLPAAHSHLEGVGEGGVVCQHTYIVCNLSFFSFNYQMPNFIQSSSRRRPFMHHGSSWLLAVCPHSQAQHWLERRNQTLL